MLCEPVFKDEELWWTEVSPGVIESLLDEMKLSGLWEEVAESKGVSK